MVPNNMLNYSYILKYVMDFFNITKNIKIISGLSILKFVLLLNFIILNRNYNHGRQFKHLPLFSPIILADLLSALG